MLIHVVQAGETLDRIAAVYGVSPARLRSDNGVGAAGELVVGQALVVQFPSQTYTVQAGDTVESIAANAGISTRQLWRNNPSLITSPFLREGEVLTLSFMGEKIGAARVDGYAYPNIDLGLLDSTLPFLSSLTIFGYGFTDEGELIPINDDVLLARASTFGVTPILLLSTVTEQGQFDSDHATKMLQNPAVWQVLTDNLIEVMQRKGYRGVNVDFEFVQPSAAADYAAFMRYITERMNAYGWTVTVDLAPKTSREQTGLLYEAHDYAALGAAANSVLLMTYEWGYTYGPPMAVAPIGEVRRVLNYGLTEIPAEKIYLGIPNYAYDWTLPFERGITAAETLGNLQAVQRAAAVGASILYDETAQAPMFSYVDPNGKEHVVWFEDARSIEQKLRLVAQNGLLGTGYWNIMRPFPQNWVLLNALLDIE